MSYINMATLSEDSREQLGLSGLMADVYGIPSYDTFRDGEELIAAQEIVKRLAELKNGELLVVEVDYF